MQASRSSISLLVSAGLMATLACDDGAVAPERADAVSHSSATSARIGDIGEVEPVLSFDLASGELPEGIAFDKRGNMFVTLAPLGTVLRIDPAGSTSILATFAVSAGAPGALGLASDARGNVYVAVASFDPATHGVHRVTPEGLTARLEGTEEIAFPNGLALGHKGTIYITDSVTGAIWRSRPSGSAEPWIQDELLEGTGAFGLGIPIGANGIAYHRGVVYALNSEKGLALRIPVERDGSAGQPALITGGAELFGLDGLAMDVHGRLYAVVNVQDRLIRVDPGSGEVTDLVADGLDFPAALAFGTGRGLRKTVFVANFALLDDPASPTPPGPGIVRLDVGVPGLPLP